MPVKLVMPVDVALSYNNVRHNAQWKLVSENISFKNSMQTSADSVMIGDNLNLVQIFSKN